MKDRVMRAMGEFLQAKKYFDEISGYKDRVYVSIIGSIGEI